MVKNRDGLELRDIKHDCGSAVRPGFIPFLIVFIFHLQDFEVLLGINFPFAMVGDQHFQKLSGLITFKFA